MAFCDERDDHHRDLNLEATELRLGLPGTSEDNQKLMMMMIVGKNKQLMRISSKRSALVLDINGEEDEDHHDQSRHSNNGDHNNSKPSSLTKKCHQESPPPAKAQVVGWPPVRSYRKNCFQAKKKEAETCGIYVKVSMDGAPYLRKIDLKVYNNYPDLLKALEDLFKFRVGEYSEREGYNGSEFAPTYEDKDGDWMLLGDVPWDMFINSCKRLRIMKGSEARGLQGCAV